LRVSRTKKSFGTGQEKEYLLSRCKNLHIEKQKNRVDKNVYAIFCYAHIAKYFHETILRAEVVQIFSANKKGGEVMTKMSRAQSLRKRGYDSTRKIGWFLAGLSGGVVLLIAVVNIAMNNSIYWQVLDKILSLWYH
jgi:hypothetical protein